MSFIPTLSAKSSALDTQSWLLILMEAAGREEKEGGRSPGGDGGRERDEEDANNNNKSLFPSPSLSRSGLAACWPFFTSCCYEAF